MCLNPLQQQGHLLWEQILSALTKIPLDSFSLIGIKNATVNADFMIFFSLYFCLWKRFSRQGWHLCCHFLLFIAGKTAARENSTQCRKQRKRSCDDLKDLRCASSSNTDSYNENLSSLALKLMAILIKHTRTPPMSLIALFGKEMQIFLINKMTNLFPKLLPALEVFTKTLITSATRYC